MVLLVQKPDAEPKEMTVVTDAKTRIAFLGAMANGTRYEPRLAALQDLKADMRVQAIPETGTATKIYISPVSPRTD